MAEVDAQGVPRVGGFVETRVRRNKWGVLSPPPIGDWRPTRSVSVIVPAYQGQELLDLTLAALSRQTYPSELFEVVVADDGSEPKIELPEVAPAHCRVVRVPDYSMTWGRANALHTGATHSEGEILHWLDADLIPFPDHVEAQARWHHLIPDAVTLGYKRFVRDGRTTAAEILARIGDGSLGELFAPEDTDPHDYVEELIDTTDDLRDADHLGFRAHVGATAAVRRELYLAAGGLDPELKLGEDTEFGYRLTQAGAVFIPEPRARSWHMGPSHMMTTGARLRRYNQPFLASRMPHPRWLRGGAARVWPVPLVVAVVEAGDRPLELVRACVDRLLASDERDLKVLLVGDWAALTDDRRSVLADPLLDRRLLAATYQDEARVQLVNAVPESAFPSPYLLRVPRHLGVGPGTVRALVDEADSRRAGLVRMFPPGTAAGVGPGAPALELWRTSAVSRARRHQRPGETLAEAVAACHGARWFTGSGREVVDLSALSEAELRGARPPVAPPRATAAGYAVPVAGARSLARATGYVFRLSISQLGRRLRRLVRR